MVRKSGAERRRCAKNMPRSGDVKVYKKDTSPFPNSVDKVGLNIKGFDNNNMPRSGDVMVCQKDMSHYFVDKVGLNIKGFDMNNLPRSDKVGLNIKGFDKKHMPRSGDVTVYEDPAIRTKIAELLRNRISKPGGEQIFNEYVDRMKKKDTLWMCKPEDVTHEEYADDFEQYLFDEMD